MIFSSTAVFLFSKYFTCHLTLLHSEWPKLYGVLAILSAVGLKWSVGCSECNRVKTEFWPLSAIGLKKRNRNGNILLSFLV